MDKFWLKGYQEGVPAEIDWTQYRSLTHLLEYCKEQLTGYKRPKFIEFRETLPKTNVGKILRRELRDEKQTA